MIGPLWQELGLLRLGVKSGAFDPSQLPSKLLWTGADTSFDHTTPLLSGTGQYFTTANVAWTNGLTKFSVAGHFTVGADFAGNTYSLAGLNNAGNTSSCFWIARDNNGSGNNGLLVRIYTSLTGGQAQGETTLKPLTPSGGSGTPSRYYHIAFVFDGSQVGNANRLKLYINGVRDPSVTFTGTIPAQLTSSTGTLALAQDVFQGGPLNGKMANWGMWAGTALTDAQVAALAGSPDGVKMASGAPFYNTFGDIPSAVPTPTHFWLLGESSNGSAPVSRLDSVRTNPCDLTDVGNVPSQTAAVAIDRSGNGFHGSGVWYYANNALSLVTQSAAQLNGLPAWVFPTGGSTHNLIQFDKLGLTNNPANWTIWDVVRFDADISNFLHGSDQKNGNGAGNNSANCWAALNAGGDLVAEAHGGILGITTGDGTNVNAGVSNSGLYAVGSWHIVRLRYTAGAHTPEIWVDGVQATVTDQGAIPVAPYAEISSSGGTMQLWTLGEVGNYDQRINADCFKGAVAEHVVIAAAPDNATCLKMDEWLGAKYGISVP